jgi:hypothetical protein
MLVSVSDQVLHIAIDVSWADDELRGRVGDGVQEARAFIGWLGLIGALDEIMDSLRQDGSMPSARTPDHVTSATREERRCS